MKLFPLRILLNIENGGTTGGGTAAVALPVVTQPVAAPATGDAWRNPEEIKANFVQVRALTTQVAELSAKLSALASSPAPGAATKEPGASAATTSAADITAQITAEVTFNTTLAMTQGLSGDQQGMLRTLFAAEKPAPGQLGDWMRIKLAALGRAPTAPAGTAQQAATPPQTQARTDLGAPAAGVGDALPDDPRAIPIDQWKAMDPTRRHEITKRWMSRNGGNTGILSRKRA